MKEEFYKKKGNVIAIALFCSLLWGSAFPVLKLTYLELNMKNYDLSSKVVLAGYRFFIAALMIFLFVKFILKISIKVQGKDIILITFLGLLQTTFSYFFFYNGLANTSAMKGAILGTLENFLVVIAAHFIYKDDRLNYRKTIGLCTGLLGVIVVNWGQSFDGGFKLSGEGFMILSALMSTMATFVAKKLGKKMNPVLMSAWQMLIGSILMIVVGSVMGGNDLNFTAYSYGLLIYSSLLSAISFSLWYMLLKYNNAGEISLFRFMIPVSGAVLSALMLPEEKLTLRVVFALILVASGIIFINYDKR